MPRAKRRSRPKPKSSSAPLVIVGGLIVVASIGGFFLVKKDPPKEEKKEVASKERPSKEPKFEAPNSDNGQKVLVPNPETGEMESLPEDEAAERLKAMRRAIIEKRAEATKKVKRPVKPAVKVAPKVELLIPDPNKWSETYAQNLYKRQVSVLADRGLQPSEANKKQMIKQYRDMTKNYVPVIHSFNDRCYREKISKSQALKAWSRAWSIHERSGMLGRAENFEPLLNRELNRL